MATAIHAKLTYVWLPKVRNSTQDSLLLNEGKCDVFLDIDDNQPGYLSTIAYFQTTYVFVYRAGAPFHITSLDDKALHELTIGVGTGTAPDLALTDRGLGTNLRHYFSATGSLAPGMLADLADGKLDVAVLWGPDASYLAPSMATPFTMVPVTPQVDVSSVPLTGATAMGVRLGDKELADLLSVGLAKTWDQSRTVLRSFHVPLIPLPKPVVSLSSR